MTKFPAVLLFLGPEEGQKNEEIDALRGRVAQATGGPPEEHKFYLTEVSIGDVVDRLRNGSLFSAFRFVRVYGAETLKKKDDLATLADYLAAPAGDAILVLVSEETRADARLEKLLPADSRKVFWELFENQKRGWVVSYVRKQGASFDADALDLFLELVESNTNELRAEADKLIVFVGRSGTITIDDVETFIFHSRDENVFTLYKRVVDDDFAAALEVLATMISSDDADPVPLISGLVYHVRRLLSLRALLDGRTPFDAACTRLGIRGKRIQADFRAGTDRFSRSELERQVYLLIEYDAAFREYGARLSRILLETLVYQLMFRSDGIHVGGSRLDSLIA
ncbi:MAG: DNA polymerase III subunit delta [Spirochaetaceae bacterium]|nr:MAG: DNA polymerase III subunit delta [Spirochaetaceae bacterium]